MHWTLCHALSSRVLGRGLSQKPLQLVRFPCRPHSSWLSLCEHSLTFNQLEEMPNDDLRTTEGNK